MKKKILFGILAGVIMSVALTGCSGSEANSDETSATTSVETTVAETTEAAEGATDETDSATTETEIPEVNVDELQVIEISSSNVTDGVWDTKITNTTNGENVSPELSWSAVDGAVGYEVLMIDTDASWLHLIAYTEGTSFGLGEIDGTNGNKYIGPYPPSGTHHYVIYVVAVKDMPGDFLTRFDGGYNEISKYVNKFNIDQNGNAGNAIGFGSLEATYTYGD